MSSSDHNPRISVLGATFNTNNLGVSALTEGTIRAVLHRFPRASIFLLDYAREGFTQRFQLGDREVLIPLVNMRFSKRLYLSNNIAVLLLLALLLKLIPSASLRQKLAARNRCLRHIQETAVFLSVAGGDSFSDTYGLGRLLYVSLPQLLVLLLNKRLLLLPQTIGPFRGKIARAIGRYILKRAARIYSRDHNGIRYAESLVGGKAGCGRARFCYDMGFAVDPSVPRELEVVGLSLDRRDNRSLVGLNVSGLLYAGGYTGDNMFGLRVDYRSFVDQLISFLIQEKKLSVLLVPHVFGSPEDLESDSEACRIIYERLKTAYGDRIGCVRGRCDQSEIKYIIGQCDFFVGSRMHACIAALSQNVPTVAVAYSDKFIGVLETIGVDSLVVDPRKMGGQELIGRIGQAYDQRSLVRKHLETRIPQIRKRVLDLFADLKDLCSVAQSE